MKNLTAVILNRIKSTIKIINDYNQIFVDTVRKTGDNNTKRWLIIPGWNTNIDYTAGDYGFKFLRINTATNQSIKKNNEL